MDSFKIMGWLPIIAILALVLLVGINVIKSNSSCDETDIVTLVRMQDCNQLSKSYQCCKDKVFTVFDEGNCDKKYVPLIAEVCK